MKQGKPVITLAMMVMAVAIAIYFGFYVFDTFNDPFSTTLAYAYTEYDSAQAHGILVREEQVLTSQEGIIEVVCGESEKVAVGELVARIYKDTRAQANYAQLDQLEQEIALLQSVVGEGVGVESAARLDENILQSAVELRASMAQGDFTQLEEQVSEVKSNVLKRGYTYGDGVSAADLGARLKELMQQRSEQSQQFSSAAANVRASRPGVFSSFVDGYESQLTPALLENISAGELEQFLNAGTSHTPAGCVGKLITDDRWYFACVLEEETARRLSKMEADQTISVRFTGDFSQDVDMRVERVAKAEEGRCVVVLSSDRYLYRTTQLRQQTAQILFDGFEGLRVPKQALRMEYETITDKESGVEKQLRILGVYVLVGGRAEFKEVEVVAEGSDYYVLRAAETGSRAFRAGDEVIVQAVGLQDGQLLEF